MKKARLAALTLASMMVLSQAAWADNVIVAPNPGSGGTAVTSAGSTGSVDTSNGSVITSVGPTSEKVLTEKGYLVYSGNELMAGNTYNNGVGPGGSTGSQVQTQTTVESTATQSQPAGTNRAWRVRQQRQRLHHQLPLRVQQPHRQMLQHLRSRRLPSAVPRLFCMMRRQMRSFLIKTDPKACILHLRPS